MLDHVQQRLLGPVDVLEHEHERLHARELLGPRPRRPEELLALVLALARTDQPGRRREQIRDRVALAARAQLLERVADRVVVGDARGRLDHLGERPVRDALAEGQGASAEDRRALDALDELVDEAALADAGLAEDGDQVRAAVADRARKRVLQDLQLDLTSDERGRRKRALRLRRDVEELPAAKRLDAAADRHGIRGLGDDDAVREAQHAGPDQDRPLGRGLLEPCGEVDGLARRERRVGVLDDDLAGLDADPHAEAHLLDRGHDLERGAKGALRVVLVRERDAERGHDGVAGELLDGAAVRHDAARDAVEVVVDALPDDLRIGARDQPCGVDEIDEQDGRQLPFHSSSLGSGEEATAVP